MAPEKLFSIGDVARLFHISTGSLRHYENVGLLLPAQIDPDTGYRYYSTRQVEVLNTIRYLRALDMPLTEIGDFLHNKDVARMEEILCRQKAVVAEKQRQLHRIQRKLDNRLHQLRTAQECRLGVIELAVLPACRMAWVAAPPTLHGSLDIEEPIRRLERSRSETVVFLGKLGVSISAEHLLAGDFSRYDGFFLVLDEEDDFDGEFTCLPETLCARLRFHGSHGEALGQYGRLMDYLRRNGLRPADFSREITLIDSAVTNDPEKFVTEICIPVAGDPPDSAL